MEIRLVETGTYSAALTFFLSSILEVANPAAKILTVDIDSTAWNATVEGIRSQPPLLKLKERIEFLEGSSVAPEVVERVRSRIQPGQKVLVILDSDHTKAHVLAEMNAYGPMVTPGSYLIVTDTQLDRFVGTPGPLAAVGEFLETNRSFAIDRKRPGNRTKRRSAFGLRTISTVLCECPVLSLTIRFHHGKIPKSMAPGTLPPLRPTDVVGALVFLLAVALFAWTIARIVLSGV